MKHSLVASALTSTLLLSSCASFQKDWVDQNCNKESSYAQGMNDARAGHAMDHSQYRRNCAVETQEALLGAYREGYENGLKSIPAPAVSPNTIIIQQGNATSVTDGRWICQMDYFGRPYTGVGRTEEDARERGRTQFIANACQDDKTSFSATLFKDCREHGVMASYFNNKANCSLK